MVDALITALTRCHRQGTRLRAADWQHAVQSQAEAYAVQDGVAAALGWPMDRWKSGAARREGPYGHSPVNLIAGQHLLGVEVEVALRLARDVGPAEAQGETDGLIDAMCVAVELIASRWEEGLAAPELLRFADHQSNAGLLLGEWLPYRPLDWARVPWRLTLEGQPGSPAWAVTRWPTSRRRAPLAAPRHARGSGAQGRQRRDHGRVGGAASPWQRHVGRARDGGGWAASAFQPRREQRGEGQHVQQHRGPEPAAEARLGALVPQQLCPSSAPGQPPNSASACSVPSATRQLPRWAARLSPQ